jgi:hypothetical protein
LSCSVRTVDWTSLETLPEQENLTLELRNLKNLSYRLDSTASITTFQKLPNSDFKSFDN